MAIGYGPGADMMRDYEVNRKKLGRSKSLKEVADMYDGKSGGRELIFKKMTPKE